MLRHQKRALIGLCVTTALTLGAVACIAGPYTNCRPDGMGGTLCYPKGERKTVQLAQYYEPSGVGMTQREYNKFVQPQVDAARHQRYLDDLERQKREETRRLEEQIERQQRERYRDW